MHFHAGVRVALWADKEVASCHQALGDQVERLLEQTVGKVYRLAPQG